jgi:hypothetical protein
MVRSSPLCLFAPSSSKLHPAPRTPHPPPRILLVHLAPATMRVSLTAVTALPPITDGAIVSLANQFVGARVVRSMHWHYGDQDGGPGNAGTIIGRDNDNVRDEPLFLSRPSLLFPLRLTAVDAGAVGPGPRQRLRDR